MLSGSSCDSPWCSANNSQAALCYVRAAMHVFGYSFSVDNVVCADRETAEVKKFITRALRQEILVPCATCTHTGVDC